ncbi:hypothetical protein EJ08DRAFT_666644 [Tothia fuscella]|uniref:Uncharacterized protein n=1 Tax=Tothia fuscella TaxID=1048955 RepID=A0A9P4TSC5_9PEZI|nr:hypothetical protein EJ08DRAFT_666644 [Tothia fuscella]
MQSQKTPSQRIPNQNPTLTRPQLRIPPKEASTGVGLDNSDKVCLFGKCIGENKPGHSKCNIEQCFSAASPTIAACVKAAFKPKTDIFDQIACAGAILNLGDNMPNTCKDCITKLKDI